MPTWENPTELSFAGMLKWLLVVVCLTCLFAAGVSFLGPERNVREGLTDILAGGLTLLAALAVWFFWQRNED